jgi:hypothetical protein
MFYFGPSEADVNDMRIALQKKMEPRKTLQQFTQFCVFS